MGAQKESAFNEGYLTSIPGWGRSLEKEMATHSSILAWGIPWIDVSGGLQSMGLQTVRHDWATNTGNAGSRYIEPCVIHLKNYEHYR